MRRVWVEISAEDAKAIDNEASPSLRRVWVEIEWLREDGIEPTVTLLAEGVG